MIKFRPWAQNATPGAILASPLFPAMYHVDATGGNDGNDGLSPGAAWQTIGKVNGETFQPGDTVLFKRGEIWRDRLEPPSSGVAGRKIVFGAYGTGSKPILSGSDLVTGWAAQGGNVYRAILTEFGGGPSAVYFNDVQGTKVANIGALAADMDWVHDATGSPHYLYIYSDTDPSTRVIEATIQWNCFINNGQSYLRFEDIRTEKSRFVSIILAGDTTDLVLSRVEVDRSYNQAIQVGNGGGEVTPSNVTIENCALTLFNRQANAFAPGVWQKLGVSGGNNLVVRYNTITCDVVVDNGGTSWDGINIQDGDDVLIERNVISGVDHGVVVIGSGAGGGIDTYTIRYNDINSHDDAFWLNGTTATDAVVHHNLVRRTGDQIVDLRGEGGSIYNNTCYETVSNGLAFHTIAGTKAIVKNNIFTHIANGSSVFWLDDNNGVDPTDSTFDNNIYYRTSPIAAFGAFSGGGTFTFNDWQTTYSQDQNGLNENPDLVSPSADLHLQSISPCRDAGVDVGLTEDYDGVSVPQETNPAIGAYEYVA